MPYIKSNLESQKHNWNLNYNTREIMNWFINKPMLIESLHRFENDNNSEYRKTLL